MSAYRNITTDQVVTKRPCRLYSVVLTATATDVADTTLYDAHGAESGQEIVTVKAATNTTRQVSFRGLQLDRGLYVDVGSNVTRITIEWEPVGYKKEQAA